ncbi:hypothetical protein FQZ97_965910 [compost metagenome]
MTRDGLADLGHQRVTTVHRQLVTRRPQAETIGVQQLLTQARRQGGRQQEHTATLTRMGRQQFLQQNDHIAVVGMHFVDQQHLAGQPKQSQRLVACRQHRQ